MNSPKNILIEDYDYPLPEERIAKFPLEQRDHSKLLIYHNGEIAESQFFHVPELLPQNSLLIFNNTKVIHARLFFQKATGSTIEVFCLEHSILWILFGLLLVMYLLVGHRKV